MLYFIAARRLVRIGIVSGRSCTKRGQSLTTYCEETHHTVSPTKGGFLVSFATRETVVSAVRTCRGQT